MSGSERRCNEHRKLEAGWRCDACPRDLCEKCTAKVLNRFYCVHCEKPATQFTRPRTEIPYSSWLINSLAFPIKRISWVLLAAVLVFGIGELAELLGPDSKEEEAGSLIRFLQFSRLAGMALFVAACVDFSAYGSARPLAATIKTIGRTLVSGLVFIVPGAAYLAFVVTDKLVVFEDPLFLMYCGLVWVYLPVVLAASSTDLGITETVNPFRIFEWQREVGLRYLLALLIFAGLVAGAAGALSSAPQVSGEQLIDSLIGHILAFALLAVAARVIGLLVYVYGEGFGWGTAESYHDPILSKDAEGVRQSDIEAAKKALEEQKLGKIQKREKPESTAARELKQCLRDGNFLRAVKLYESRSTWTKGALEDRDLVKLAQGAARAKKVPVAQSLLAEAIAENGLARPRALFAMARLHVEQLDDKAKAKKLFEQLLSEHPDSDAAKQAKTQLTKL